MRGLLQAELGLCTRWGQGQSARGRRRRVDDPPGTTSALKGLFKIIEFCSRPDSPLVVETLLAESERLADIIR